MVYIVWLLTNSYIVVLTGFWGFEKRVGSTMDILQYMFVLYIIVRNGQVIGTATKYNVYYRTLSVTYTLNFRYIPVSYCDVHKNENWCFSLFP